MEIGLRLKICFLCVIGLSVVIAQRPNSPTRFYEDIKCKPIKRGNKIVAYDCLFMQPNFPENQCIYKGQVYNQGDFTSGNECGTFCFCDEGFNGGRSRFICAVSGCPPPPDGCLEQFKIDDCCGYNTICDKDEIKKLKTCRWKSSVYKEGELFFTKDTCQRCVCDKDFKGKLVKPWCEPINCKLELGYSDSIFGKCALIYRDNDSCCPYAFFCPYEGGHIKKGPPYKNSKLKCHFGNQTMNIGDRIVSKKKCLSCACDVPPLATCIAKSNCLN